MPSTYTPNLGIEKPATGEQDGTWGGTVNTNYDLFDEAIGGLVTVTLAAAGSSGSPNALAITDGASSNGRNKWITFDDGGDLGADAYVQLTPNDAEKVCYVTNSLSASRSIFIFQGTWDAARDYELTNGTTAAIAFSGGGAGASTVTELISPASTTLTGINDLATGTRLEIQDDEIVLGSANVTYGIRHVDTDQYLFFSGGSTVDLGANFKLYGEAHATLANDIQFRENGNDVLYYDDSGNLWDFQSKAVTTAGVLTVTDVLVTAAASITLGPNDTTLFTLKRTSDTGSVAISGGTGTSNGANMELWGGTHATTANDVKFRADATDTLVYDDSASTWDFQDNQIITGGSLGLDERAAALGDVAGRGQLYTRNSDGALMYKYATDDAVNVTGGGAWSKSITVENPGASEDITVCFTNVAITLSEIRAVLIGSSSPSVTWTLKHATDRSAAGTTIDSNTTTGTTTGDDITVISDPTIPADSYIWLETSAQSGTVTEIHITMIGTPD